MRRPIFDISVKAHKKSPYSRLAQNEMAKELFRLGFFEPRNSFAALSALEIMDFEGKSAIEAKIRELASTVKEMRGEENDKNNGAEAGEQILSQN